MPRFAGAALLALAIMAGASAPASAQDVRPPVPVVRGAGAGAVVGGGAMFTPLGGYVFGSVFVAAAAIQLVLLLAGVRGWKQAAAVGPALVLTSFALVLIGVWMNRRLPGVWLAGIGVALNFAVIAANGGAMPVDRDLAVKAGSARLVEMLDSPAYAKHARVGPATRLRPLADVLPLPMLVPRPRFFSPGSVGDVFVTVGACWLILVGMGAFGLGRPTGQGQVPAERQ